MSKEDLPPSRTAEQFVVRFPDGMRDRIAEAAKAAGRSMNAEIVQRLQESFAKNSWPLPSAILSKAEEAAASKGRTVDAELFDRVLESFADRPEEAVRLRKLLDEERDNVLKLQYEVLKLQNSAMDGQDVLYILLDANGYPIAWEEIYAYLDEVRRLSGKLPSKWETTIITPDLENSSQRAQHAIQIVRKLRDTGISQALGRASRSAATDPSGIEIEDATVKARKIPIEVRGKKGVLVIPDGEEPGMGNAKFVPNNPPQSKPLYPKSGTITKEKKR